MKAAIGSPMGLADWRGSRQQKHSSMKTLVYAVTWTGITISLLSLPPAAHASSPPADSVHVCAFDDHQQWRRDHPRPSAKPLADLDVGEPRTVRMIYFLPKDRPFRQEVVDSMKVVIRQIQQFYAEQMEAHGYGDRTFRIETDAQGEPVVHRVDGQHPDSHYLEFTNGKVLDEIVPAFDLHANIYFIVIDNFIGFIDVSGTPAAGVGVDWGKSGGFLLVSEEFDRTLVAHELGHAFGLYHDFRDDAYTMSYGPGENQLSECAAEFLAVDTYFNPDIPVEEGTSPTIRLLSPRTYPAGTTSVPVQLEVADPEGIHQVILLVEVGGEVKECRGLAGKEAGVVEFEYDGAIPSEVSSSLYDPVVHTMRAIAVDTDGNVKSRQFGLSEHSPQQIATLEHEFPVSSLAFSPDGTLASGSLEKVELWDVATREPIATLAHSHWVSSVAFSPDGNTLASSLQEFNTVQLRDATTNKVTTLEGHTDLVPSVRFSPDGTLLASGSWDGTVKLWDMAAQEEVATLEGHTDRVHSVAFSPDGTLLASGSRDGTVKLWDVATRENTATLEGHEGGARSVVFSPDGNLLASGTGRGPIKLWDVATREVTVTLEGHGRGVNSVVFSPDGTILASGSSDYSVKLWDVGAGSDVATFKGHTHWVDEVAFSPDGTLLVSGSQDRTAKLWDLAEWPTTRQDGPPGGRRPRPSALAIISGDGQQGQPGAALTQPLVVEVQDQYGDPLPDAAVTFTVTTGEGKLSGRFTVERATTDASGRAELTLTLGPLPGRNIVGVSLGWRELGTFAADGVGVAVAELEGDYRTWHLPEGATARLGKGALGWGDRAVALSADGRCLAVASGIGVWLYEAATSRALALLPTESAVHSVSFSLDGTLAAGVDNGRVELWEVETGERIGALRHGDRGFSTVAFSPDGATLATGSVDQVIKVWDVATWQEVGTWEVQERSLAPPPVAFSPDGTRLASGGPDGTVRLWDVAAQEEVATLQGHTGWVGSVSFSPDGGLLASGGDDHTVRLWDAATQAQVATLEGHTFYVVSVAFSPPDGATLASGSWDGTVRLWDLATHQEMSMLQHGGWGNPSRTVGFSRDGATLVYSAGDGTVLLRNLETGNTALVSGHTGPRSLSSMALSPDGVLLAAGYQYSDGTGAVRLWDVATRTPVATLQDVKSVHSVVFSPDGALLASGGGGGRVSLWDMATRTSTVTLERHSDAVRSVAFSPDGALLASSDRARNGTVRLWDVGTRELIGTLEESTTSVALSPPDGALLASAGGFGDKTVKLWDVKNRDLIGTLESHRHGVETVVFSPDGRTLASGSLDATVKLWDVTTRTPVATLQDVNRVYSVVFSPDGALLASGSEVGTVSLWDVPTKERTAILEGHRDRVHSVAISRDGATLASGAWDGTTLLWDMQLVLPHPRTLTKLSGDEQQGLPAAQLAEPFVVSVLDQNGAPLAGATVTFAVTAGGGTLSTTTAATDADGRAAATLTLGSQPGPNTVEATVAELEPVTFTATVLAPRSLTQVSGDEQEGPAGAALSEPFVVEVRDQNGTPFAGASVNFTVTAGGGSLSTSTATTDAAGRAATTLTLGNQPETNTVTATVAGLGPVTFTAAARATPDFDGDGDIGFSDFFLFAEAFGGSDPRFDLDGSGTVDFTDFFLFAEHFGQPVRAKLLALARERIGLPDGPQLQQNAPNPFNSETVISWFLLRPGPAQVEVFALTGQRVAVLHEGPKKAGVHRVHWDGRDNQGRPLASGVYLYRLSTAEAVQTRKLTLLR